jgi:heme oxygenase
MSGFQRRMVSGSLPIRAYAAWLEQMLLVYRALESGLREGSLPPAHAALLTDDRRRTPQLENDLRDLGVVSDSVAGVPATEAFVIRLRDWARAGSPELLGVLYVLEGSTNGSRFIARVLRNSYGMDSAGLTFLDPYGSRQPECWRTFKRELNAAVGAEELNALVLAARATFEAVTAIGQELQDRYEPSPDLPPVPAA